MANIPVFGKIVSGLLYVDTTAVATGADTNETTLMSYTLPANTLTASGEGLRILAWGITAANGNNKTIKAYFGAGLSSNRGVLALNNGAWCIDCTIVRTSEDNQDSIANSTFGVAGADVSASEVRFSAITETESAGILIKITGENGTESADDISCQGLRIEFFN